jgi:hypothetical protein
VRWVGAAAASVVVWEWVERIEALEREEKRDGILGREVFDGDDTLEVNASEFPWFRQRRNHKDDSDNRGGGGGGGRQQESHGWTSVSTMGGQARGRGHAHHAGRRNQHQWRQQNAQQTTAGPIGGVMAPLWPSRPPATATPISRTDTASAASTVYAVRYQPASESMTRTPDLQIQPAADSAPQSSPSRSHAPLGDSVSTSTPPGQTERSSHIMFPPIQRPADLELGQAVPQDQQTQSGQTNAGSRPEDSGTLTVGRLRDEFGRWDLRARFEDFAANQADRIRERLRPTSNTESLPVMVIPAPARKGAALQQVLEEEEARAGANGPSSSGSTSRPGNSSTTRDGTEEMMQLDRTRSVVPTQETPLPANNPPLWPGVQHGAVYDDDDEYSYEGDSVMSDTISVDRGRRGSGEGSRPSQAPRGLTASR